jgi:LuxR family maltose regulon positive regulatory protein
LLRTAFLDRFCAALCDAVCGIEDGESRSISGGEFIRRINDTAFFSIPLDSKQRWFRYHHLFQAMLKEQAVADLGEDEIRAVHRRASHWFESEGLLEEAIKHALEADGAPAAAAMIIRQRHTIMNNEEWHRLDAWLRLLPEELLASRPELLLLKARQLRTAGSREEVDHYLERAESLLDITDLDDGTRRELRGSIESTRCYQLYTMSDGPAAAAAARKALELLPTESLAERGFASIILGGALQMTGEFSEGRRVLYASMSDPSAGGAQSPTLKTRLLVGLAFIHWMHGDLNALKPLVEETVALAEQMDLREVLTVAKTFEAAIYYQRNELTTVHDVLRDLLHRRAIANAEFHVQCMISLALAHQALGNSKAASQVADALQTTALRAQNVFLIGVADAFAAELALRQGRMAEARKWAAQYDPEPLTPMYSPLSPALVLAKILVLDTSEDGRERAGAVLEQLVDYLTRTHNNRFLAEALALRAMLRDMEGLSQAAAEDLTTAIALAQPGRFIRLFVDLGPRLGNLLSRLELDDERLLYAGEILAAFRQPTAQTDAYVASAPTGTPTLALDPLSDREQQILGLLAERLSNKEIADRLHVSTVTVKRHAANIYQKLGVHSRRQAVAKASGLGMITRTK